MVWGMRQEDKLFPGLAICLIWVFWSSESVCRTIRPWLNCKSIIPPYVSCRWRRKEWMREQSDKNREGIKNKWIVASKKEQIKRHPAEDSVDKFLDCLLYNALHSTTNFFCVAKRKSFGPWVNAFWSWQHDERCYWAKDKWELYIHIIQWQSWILAAKRQPLRGAFSRQKSSLNISPPPSLPNGTH